MAHEAKPGEEKTPRTAAQELREEAEKAAKDVRGEHPRHPGESGDALRPNVEQEEPAREET
ncbi:hypothetical protein G3I76_09235 [Streptomyces sp. SID11233]|uniref:hypothetical protein n=1 Tax=Streptomyces sp. SID11385 TaxID=2706031 RepID=UPI0013C16842|nr:hypothetical protein [Streptomyces sp. SID11385]NEA43193.1 hypothetical protein [Streptomyces sp. SID11385]NED80266.1 hypothetical protein [Streptomyces sp. SID11233]